MNFSNQESFDENRTENYLFRPTPVVSYKLRAGRAATKLRSTYRRACTAYTRIRLFHKPALFHKHRQHPHTDQNTYRTKIRSVRFIRSNPSMFHHPFIRPPLFTTITSIISKTPGTIQQILLAQFSEPSGFEKQSAFNRSNRSETPTRSADRLIFDRSHRSVQSPVYLCRDIFMLIVLFVEEEPIISLAFGW